MNVLQPRSCFTIEGKHKRTFEDKATAKLHVPKHLEVYECLQCGLFHYRSKRGKR